MPKPKTYAFPTNTGDSGMDLRDYFAAKILAGLLSNENNEVKDSDGIRSITEFSYDLADAMMLARVTRHAG
jgi:hypothetical protein